MYRLVFLFKAQHPYPTSTVNPLTHWFCLATTSIRIQYHYNGSIVAIQRHTIPYHICQYGLKFRAPSRLHLTMVPREFAQRDVEILGTCMLNPNCLWKQTCTSLSFIKYVRLEVCHCVKTQLLGFNIFFLHTYKVCHS